MLMAGKDASFPAISFYRHCEIKMVIIVFTISESTDVE